MIKRIEAISPEIESSVLVDGLKFSEFTPGGILEPGDIIVGLRTGVNTQFDASLMSVSIGGTGATVQQLGGVTFYDGGAITSNAILTFDAIEKLVLSGNQPAMQMEIDSSLTGVANEAFFRTRRGDTTNGFAGFRVGTNSPTVDYWDVGIRPGSTNLQFYDIVAATNRLSISSATGQVNISSLTASSLVATDSSKNLSNASTGATLTLTGGSLQTLALTGDVTSSANSFVTTISAGSVTYAKIQNVGATKVLANATASPATVQEISLGSALTFSGTSINVATQGITNSMIANGTIDLTTKVTGVLPIANGGTNASSQASNGLCFYNGTSLTTSTDLYRGGTGIVTFSATGAVVAPTGNTQFNLSTSDTNSKRIVLSGQEWYQTGAGTTSTEGISLVLGKNRTSDRELWIIDSALAAKNTTNPAIRLVTTGTGTPVLIDSVSTDGSTFLPIDFGNSTVASRLFGSTLSITGSNTSITGSSSFLITSTNFSWDGSQFNLNTPGSATDARFCGLYVGTKGSVNNGNFYGIAIDKAGAEVALWGINKNSTTTQIPSNAVYFSTYTTGGIWAIGRGGSNSQPAYADLLGDGAGSISVANGKLNMLVDAIQFYTPGKGVINKIGTNGLTGSFTLSSGTVTISNTSVDTNDHVILDYTSFSGTPGSLRFSINPGVSFTITSSSGSLDNSSGKYTIQKAS